MPPQSCRCLQRRACVPSCRKYCEAKDHYFGINVQIANANLWAGVINSFRNCNCDCGSLLFRNFFRNIFWRRVHAMQRQWEKLQREDTMSMENTNGVRSVADVIRSNGSGKNTYPARIPNRCRPREQSNLPNSMHNRAPAVAFNGVHVYSCFSFLLRGCPLVPRAIKQLARTTTFLWPCPRLPRRTEREKEAQAKKKHQVEEGNGEPPRGIAEAPMFMPWFYVFFLSPDLSLLSFNPDLFQSIFLITWREGPNRRQSRASPRRYRSIGKRRSCIGSDLFPQITFLVLQGLNSFLDVFHTELRNIHLRRILETCSS